MVREDSEINFTQFTLKHFELCMLVMKIRTVSVFSVPVADIKGLLTGKDCPHMKENKGKQTKVSSTFFRFF